MSVGAFDRDGLWHYRASYLRAIDGDTVELSIDLGFSLRRVLRVRLAGYNAPERNTREGQAAKQRMIDLFGSERYTGAVLETRYWPLRVITEKLPSGEEATSFERYVGRVYLVSETGELTDLVTLLEEPS